MTTDPDDLEARWRAVADKFRGHSEPKSLSGFLDTIAGIPDTTISHADCQALLPAFVTMELSGLDAVARYPQVQYHLDRCSDCEMEYAELLTLEIALAPMERGGMDALTLAESLALPAHYRRVKQVSERVLQRIDPGMAPVTLLFVDPLLEALGAGESVEIPLLTDERGGIGMVELIPLVVVPVVATVMHSYIAYPVAQQGLEARTEGIRNAVINELNQLLAPQSDKSSLKSNAGVIARTISDIILEILESV